MNELVQEFLRITKELNKQQQIPLLMGSLGLSVLTEIDFQPKDIDIHLKGHSGGWSIPAEEQIDAWPEVLLIMAELGYHFVDLHEHEFQKGAVIVQFASMNSLPTFANVSLDNLVRHTINGIEFLTPSLTDFLKIYCASFKDSYRRTKNNDKDLEKIQFLSKQLRLPGE